MKFRKDLTGRQFGRLTVVGFDPDRSQRHISHWWCKCSCGNPTTKSISVECLRMGTTKSCGCLQRDSARARRFIDLVGLRVGALVVQEKLDNPTGKAGKQLWRCTCDCGGTKITLGQT